MESYQTQYPRNGGVAAAGNCCSAPCICSAGLPKEGAFKVVYEEKVTSRIRYQEVRQRFLPFLVTPGGGALNSRISNWQKRQSSTRWRRVQETTSAGITMDQGATLTGGRIYGPDPGRQSVGTPSLTHQFGADGPPRHPASSSFFGNCIGGSFCAEADGAGPQTASGPQLLSQPDSAHRPGEPGTLCTNPAMMPGPRKTPRSAGPNASMDTIEKYLHKPFTAPRPGDFVLPALYTRIHAQLPRRRMLVLPG